MKTSLIFAIFIFFFGLNSSANDLKFSELRVFLSNNTFGTPQTSLNNQTAPDSVEKFSQLTGVGLEADARVKPWLKVGSRIKGIWNSVYPPNPPTPATSYLQISQYSAGLLARVPLAEKDWLQADIFAELGLANTKIDIQTISAGKGTYTRDSGFYQRAGVSVGIGSAALKIYAEAGQEFNNLGTPSYEGTLTANNVSTVDLSGPYYAVGVIISGIPSWIKPGTVSVGK